MKNIYIIMTALLFGCAAKPPVTLRNQLELWEKNGDAIMLVTATGGGCVRCSNKNCKLCYGQRTAVNMSEINGWNHEPFGGLAPLPEVDSLFNLPSPYKFYRLPKDTLASALNGSIAYMPSGVFVKDNTWKKIADTSGSANYPFVKSICTWTWSGDSTYANTTYSTESFITRHGEVKWDTIRTKTPLDPLTKGTWYFPIDSTAIKHSKKK